MSFSGQIYPNDTVGYFRIASATGRQPIEPIALGEFRIGSAPHCQLRLGDATIPDIHTVLTVERSGVLLQSRVTDPPVLVNGTPTTESLLLDGDLVELEDHRLLFRMVAEEDRITLDESAFTTNDGDNSTDRLVEKLDEQFDLIEELTRTPDQAVVELLTAVAKTATSQQQPATQPGAANSAATELEQVKNLLQRHHEASRLRMESLTEVLDNVVRQQKLIADTLEVMSARIQALDTDNGYNQHRASA